MDDDLVSREPLELDALLWAWTNATGRLPDRNTMTDEEIRQYRIDYRDILSRAVQKLTGLEPDEYLKRRARAHGDSAA